MIVNRKYFGTEKFEKVYCKLIKAARDKQLITYGEIAKINGITTEWGLHGKGNGANFGRDQRV